MRVLSRVRGGRSTSRVLLVPFRPAPPGVRGPDGRGGWGGIVRVHSSFAVRSRGNHCSPRSVALCGLLRVRWLRLRACAPGCVTDRPRSAIGGGAGCPCATAIRGWAVSCFVVPVCCSLWKRHHCGMSMGGRLPHSLPSLPTSLSAMTLGALRWRGPPLLRRMRSGVLRGAGNRRGTGGSNAVR